MYLCNRSSLIISLQSYIFLLTDRTVSDLHEAPRTPTTPLLLIMTYKNDLKISTLGSKPPTPRLVRLIPAAFLENYKLLKPTTIQWFSSKEWLRGAQKGLFRCHAFVPTTG